MTILNSIVWRLVMLVAVVLCVTLITFVISHQLPGDPAQLMAGPRAGPEAVEKMRHALGLDQPLHAQYAQYLHNLLRGDFGVSIVTQRPVLSELANVFPATLELMLTALFISVTLGVVLGVVAAVRSGSWFDHLIRATATFGISVPSFWLGLMLLLIFYGQLGILPGIGRLDDALDPPIAMTGFYTLDAALQGRWAVLWNAFEHLMLPALTLALVSFGGMLRIIRSSMIEVLGEDYVRTAIASGIPRRTVIFNHALRNALIPFVTVLGLEFAALLFGSVVVETIFMWPGAGSLVLEAIFALDFPMIMCFTVVVSMAYVIINSLVDLLYMAINPQIREIG